MEKLFSSLSLIVFVFLAINMALVYKERFCYLPTDNKYVISYELKSNGITDIFKDDDGENLSIIESAFKVVFISVPIFIGMAIVKNISVKKDKN